ncbi:adenylosuccinate synthase [Alicyclobacillus fastidiosus]|uniref:Adenylosuccinate synthetase n=1 Tax=Alicyclobacillus fastidiosus TaxID=392011 RepID=A0ABV5AB42_9BACL|nr:adenylosuccinate synthase [Alicyclobacillus fastidiosus]WEH10773.1 adenylosuccinate synthase [Alicyclobacillus fastidiosus]
MFHAVIGAQFGDEGKGKMVDYLAEQADIVVRYQGGGNAGHTIVNQYGKFALHLVPSGIFHPHTTSILGAGMVIHPGQLVRELQTLEAGNIDTSRLVISERAHMVLPYHIWQDTWEEEQRSKKVGTTLQGIGPAYQDKVGRFGLQFGELRDLARFEERLRQAWAAKLNRIPALAKYGQFEDLWTEIMAARERLLPYIQDTTPLLYEAAQKNLHVLLEGQLGIMRDLDWGVYPFVTSSSPISGGIPAGAGIPPTAIQRVTGITKAYTTAVGAGPFPTELKGAEGEYLQQHGHEYGATTGRPRACGWLDIPTLRYGAWINGYTELALMKLDVLSGLDQIGVCTAYQLDGQDHEWPLQAYDMERVTPKVEMVKGWSEDISHCRSFAELPANAQAFVEQIEAWVGVPVKFVSVGPGRDQTMIRNV